MEMIANTKCSQKFYDHWYKWYCLSWSTTHAPCFRASKITKNAETHPTITCGVIIKQPHPQISIHILLSHPYHPHHPPSIHTVHSLFHPCHSSRGGGGPRLFLLRWNHGIMNSSLKAIPHVNIKYKSLHEKLPFGGGFQY